MTDKKKNVISEDEELGKFNKDKVSSLRPAFDKDGTITAANASKLSDGGCGMGINESLINEVTV